MRRYIARLHTYQLIIEYGRTPQFQSFIFSSSNRCFCGFKNNTLKTNKERELYKLYVEHFQEINKKLNHKFYSLCVDRQAQLVYGNGFQYS